MAISWQTGEPPCGQELLIEYRECDNECYPKLRAVAIHIGENIWRLDGRKRYDFTVLRWSTLDDYRAAMAIGALEKMVRENFEAVSCSVDFAGNGWTVYDEDGAELVEAPTLIEAIEKLTADQQTKGASDEEAAD